MDRGHAELLRRREVERQVVDEHASRRVRARSPRRRAHRCAAPACGCRPRPRSRLRRRSPREARADSVSVPHELEISPVAIPPRAPRAPPSTIESSGRGAREQPVDQPFGRCDPEQPAELRLEFGLIDASLLQAYQQLAGLRVLAERAGQRARGRGLRRSQKAPKELNRLVVITPPQSTSRPLTAAVCLSHRASPPRPGAASSSTPSANCAR